MDKKYSKIVKQSLLIYGLYKNTLLAPLSIVFSLNKLRASKPCLEALFL